MGSENPARSASNLDPRLRGDDERDRGDDERDSGDDKGMALFPRHSRRGKLVPTKVKGRAFEAEVDPRAKPGAPAAVGIGNPDVVPT